MRIIAGKLKGFTLHMTKDKNTRPLKDIARESIFNLLTHSNKISLKLEQSNILDLYAGTGSFGLECISRQGKCVYFVENKKSAFQILEKNIKKLKIKKKTKLFFNDVFNFIEKRNISISKFDLSLASKIVYLSPIIEINKFPKSPSPGSFRKSPYFL